MAENQQQNNYVENVANASEKYVESAKEMSNQIANTGTQLASKATETLSNAASTGIQAVSTNVAYAQEVANTYLNNISSVFYAGIFLVIVCALIGWGLYFLIIDNSMKHQRIVVSGTEIPVICNEANDFKIPQKLDNANGNRCSFAFWIYINDINKFRGDKYRHILHIGDSHKQIMKASPYIFLDKETNKIYVRFAPTTADPIGIDDALNSVTDLNRLIKYGSNYCGFTIDYVPIQRWVHVCISVNDSKKGTVYIYIDAELQKTYEHGSTFNMNIAELEVFNSGSLYTGANINDYMTNATGFSGLISKFTMFNHDLNQNDVYKEYNNGPFSGLLTKLGLGQYGIRNPIYEINSANK